MINNIIFVLLAFFAYLNAAVKFTNISGVNSVYLTSSKAYTCSDTDASNYLAGNNFYNDIPVFWNDISQGITEKHKALGYLDVLVAVFISNITGDTNINLWYMHGDADRRDEQDIRAWCDGALYEMIDNNYKSMTYDLTYFVSYNTGKSGDFTVLRFRVTDNFTGPYKIYLGR